MNNEGEQILSSLTLLSFSFFLITNLCFFTCQIVGESMNSMGVFLSQELHRFNGLIETMASSLTSLLKAIKGAVFMSADLQVT